jgi:FixJ family two-component response regulator
MQCNNAPEILQVASGDLNIVAIVDDDGDVRDVLDALLEAAGHTVKTYQSGEQLLNDPDLGEVACLVADQRMPAMSGIDLLRALDASGRTIPSLLITGAPDPALLGEARDLGAIDVLTKPIDCARLLQLVAYAVA